MPTQNNNKEVSKCCGFEKRFRAVTRNQYGNPNTPYCGKCGKPFEPTVSTREEKCKHISGEYPNGDCTICGFNTRSNTEEWEIKFNNCFVREDGLLNIGKYDHDEIKGFIKQVIAQSETRIKAEILRNVIEVAEPYDGAKWHNTLTVEQIKKILSIKGQ